MVGQLPQMLRLDLAANIAISTTGNIAVNSPGTIAGAGSGLTGLNATNISSGAPALARITPSAMPGDVLTTVAGVPVWQAPVTGEPPRWMVDRCNCYRGRGRSDIGERWRWLIQKRNDGRRRHRQQRRCIDDRHWRDHINQTSQWFGERGHGWYHHRCLHYSSRLSRCFS